MAHPPTEFIALAAGKLVRAMRFRELRQQGAVIGRSVQTYGRFFVGRADALWIGDDVRLMPGVTLSASGARHSLTIEANVYINRNTIIDSRHGITIGDGTTIGPNTYIGDFDHSSTFDAKGYRIDEGPTAPVHIGRAVWIGANVSILKGVSVGERTLIGAGSVVTKSVPAGALVAGNPATVVRLMDG